MSTSKTGIECLKEELLKRGYTKTQADSKVVIGVLEILSQSDGKYTEIDKLVSDRNMIKSEINSLWIEEREYLKKVEVIKQELKNIINEVNELCDHRYKEVIDQIAMFFKAIEECETAEGRDALKLAQMYINSVNVDTKYDNTAFIIGLASILSKGNVAPMDELRKINDKIPNYNLKAEPNIKYSGFKEYGFIDKNNNNRYIL